MTEIQELAWHLAEKRRVLEAAKAECDAAQGLLAQAVERALSGWEPVGDADIAETLVAVFSNAVDQVVAAGAADPVE